MARGILLLKSLPSITSHSPSSPCWWVHHNDVITWNAFIITCPLCGDRWHHRWLVYSPTKGELYAVCVYFVVVNNYSHCQNHPETINWWVCLWANKHVFSFRIIPGPGHVAGCWGYQLRKTRLSLFHRPVTCAMCRNRRVMKPLLNIFQKVWRRSNKQWPCGIALRWRHNGCDGVSNHQPHDCLLNRLFRHRSKKISKLRVTGLCAGNSPVTGEFPAQRASNAEDSSIWWRHHGLHIFHSLSDVCIHIPCTWRVYEYIARPVRIYNQWHVHGLFITMTS